MSSRETVSRRSLLAGAAGAAATFALSRTALAQGSPPGFWEQMRQNAATRGVDRDANTSLARGVIETNEPILSHDTARNLARAIANYEAFIAAVGSWDPPTQQTIGLSLGKRSKAVRDLKYRLMLNGDMTMERRIGDDFDAVLDAGLRQFQARHGISISGAVDEPTYRALLVPTDYRLKQLRLNARRVEQWASALTDRYVVVNIPAASIETIEMSRVVGRHVAVVGMADRATPILNSKVYQIKFNPFWTVPKSIIRKDLIRYMNENPRYLTEFRIRILDGRGRELDPSEIDWSTEEAVQYTFRQDPGPDNSLGRCKIDFHNRHAVYLHDTPQQGLFGDNARFFSSGCVRVENVDQLVAWLLRDNGGWDVDMVRGMFASGQTTDVPLSVQVPIHTTYITAWANAQGTVSFRDDVYGFDATGQVEFDA